MRGVSAMHEKRTPSTRFCEADLTKSKKFNHNHKQYLYKKQKKNIKYGAAADVRGADKGHAGENKEHVS